MKALSTLDMGIGSDSEPEIMNPNYAESAIATELSPEMTPVSSGSVLAGN
jgi:hypothetical protein